MKGVSSVIAIILILMIVIALAALAYTWFSGIFASLTSTAGTAVTTTTSAMTTQFAIDSAKGTQSSTTINLVVRNIGTQNIPASTISVYASDAPCSGTYASAITPGTYSTSFSVTCPTTINCGTCSAHICYLSGNIIETVAVTISTGLQQSTTITC